MVKLFGSYNSRYFAVKLPNEVRLYRGITAGGLSNSNEATLLWQRNIDDKIAGELVALGNTGDLYFRSERGLFRLRQDARAQLEAVNRICAIIRGDDVGQLGKVKVDAEGRELCYEHITPEAGFKGKLFKLFSKSSGSGTNQVHSLMHINNTAPGQNQFLSALVDTKRTNQFHWNVSPSFRFMVAAIPDKKVYHIQVIDIHEEAISEEFDMTMAELGGIWINDSASLMVDVRQPGADTLIVARREGSKFIRTPFQPPAGYRVMHLAPTYVAISIAKPPRMYLYHFNGHLAADVDVTPLMELGVQFGFNFNERGDIDVLTWHNGMLQIHHSDPKSIVIDAKRWSMVARQSQLDQEEHAIREATAFHVEERKRLERMEMSRQLAATAGPDITRPADVRELPRITGSPTGGPENVYSGFPPVTPNPAVAPGGGFPPVGAGAPAASGALPPAPPGFPPVGQGAPVAGGFPPVGAGMPGPGGAAGAPGGTPPAGAPGGLPPGGGFPPVGAGAHGGAPGGLPAGGGFPPVGAGAHGGAPSGLPAGGGFPPVGAGSHGAPGGLPAGGGFPPVGPGGHGAPGGLPAGGGFPPVTPLPAAGAPATNVPVPPAVPAAASVPAPPPPPPKPSGPPPPPPPPPGAPALSFLKGGPIMPPPQTEDEAPVRSRASGEFEIPKVAKQGSGSGEGQAVAESASPPPEPAAAAPTVPQATPATESVTAPQPAAEAAAPPRLGIESTPVLSMPATEPEGPPSGEREAVSTAHPLFGPQGAPPAPPAPAAEPSPAAGAVIPSDPAEVELQLEKLRMHYIAGELSREEYYQRRSVLEASRRGGAPDSAAKPGSSPKRLELDLEPSPSPQSGNKPRIGGRKIDIGEVLNLDSTEEDA